MRVLCIDAKGKRLPDMLVDGKIYDAHQSPVFEFAYVLSELKFNPYSGNDVHFHKRRFVPLSNIDENELVTQRENTLTV